MLIPEWDSSQFAGLALMGLYLAMFALSCAVGVAASHWAHKKWVGWLVGIVVFVGFALFCSSATEALDRVACRSAADYGSCVDHDYGDSGY